MKPPPAQHTGGGGGRQQRSGSILLTGNLDQPATAAQPSSNAPPLADPVAVALRHVWWSQRRAGIRLPVERGIILIDGGKR
jgi:hypothetical protein